MSNDPTNKLAEAIRPVTIVEDLADGVKRCGVCEYRCEIAPEKVGICKMRANRGGQLVALNYGLVSKADLELIESRGFYHFFPGVKVFSLGGYGINFPSAMGSETYVELPDASTARTLPMERISKFAIDQRCRGVVFAYNEPTMYYEFLVDACKTIRANGMFTAIVTNGYANPDALDPIGFYIDGYMAEVNAFSEQTFKIFTGQTRYQKVLQLASRAQTQYKAHVEITTNLVPGVNDSDEEMTRLATWIKTVLGENIAWHLACAVPDSEAELRRVKQIGENCGLNYVYLRGVKTTDLDETAAAMFDNTVNSNTYCFNCHKLIIDRRGDAHPDGLSISKCANCETELGIRNTLWKLS